MKVICATMLLTIACALVCANAQYFQSAKFGGKDCAGSPVEDVVMDMEFVAKMYLKQPLDTCTQSKETPGMYMIVNSAACSMTMHSDKDCTSDATYTHDMSYSKAECENRDGNDPQELSEKSGCVQSIPAGAKDLTCMTEGEMMSIMQVGDCAPTCESEPTTLEQLEEMKAGCAKDCPEALHAAMLKSLVGCPGKGAASVSNARSQYALSQYARLFIIPTILVGFFSH
jgi:hypothetical protein